MSHIQKSFFANNLQVTRKKTIQGRFIMYVCSIALRKKRIKKENFMKLIKSIDDKERKSLIAQKRFKSSN